MSIFAVSDLHLSFGVPEKNMEVFGPEWVGYQEKLKENWEREIKSEDLVLIPGDISWAMEPEVAKIDLDWLDKLPGTKVMIKGNHDYWWHSLSKVKKILPPSCHVIQNDVFIWNEVAIAGTRLWETYEFGFEGTSKTNQERPLRSEEEKRENQIIFARELQRLEMSLKAFPGNAKKRLAMTHYPPIGPKLSESSASLLFEKYGVSAVVFGHLHNIKPKALPFGTRNGVNYIFTSIDYLDFCPIKIS